MIGRDEELAAVRALLSSDRTAHVLLLEGDAGIGKTTIWEAGIEQADELGHRVLTCSPSSAEARLSFAALTDLLAEAFDDVAKELPPPQRDALAVMLLREEGTGSRAEPGTIAVALLSALRALAARSPLVLAVDDVQWLDPASVAPLAYAVRRLGPEPIAVLLARRAVSGEALPLALDRVAAGRLTIQRVDPLSIGAIGRILHDRLGVAYPRPTLHRIHDVSGGNPFFALELGRALAQSSAAVRAGDPLPLPATLRELVRVRLAALADETLEALLVVSVLSRPTVGIVDAAVGRDAHESLAPAVAAEIVECDGDDVRFSHPLFAAAVYDLASAARRRDIHRRVAGVSSDVEERAHHLAAAADEPSEEIADVLEVAAATAFGRGSPAVAAELIEQALRATPAAQSEGARRRTLAAADYAFAGGDAARASALLDELLRTSAAGAERARLLSRQARVQHFGDDIGSSVALLHEALAEAGADPQLRAEIGEGLAWGLLLARRELPAAVEYARAAAEHAEDREDHTALAEALAVQALLEFVLGREWEAPMRRALSLEKWTLSLRVLRHPSFAYGYCLSCADELDSARDVFLDLCERATRQGDEGSMPSLLNHLALIDCLAGDWEAAAAHADDGYERAVEGGQRPTQASVLAKKAMLAGRAGRVSDARELAEQALALAGGPSFDVSQPGPALTRGGETAIWTLGFLALSLDEPGEAHRYLGPLADALLEAGIEEPGEVRCLPDGVEALASLDRLDEAEERLRPFERWAGRLARPSTLATAARCRGQILLARGDAEAAVLVLEEAANLHAGASMPFDHGRTVLALGTAQRRARHRKAARETFELARSIFEGLGSELWAEKARAELARIGGRAPSAGDLTSAERRIAELVADGKTNREVAENLVISVHTVEAALTQVYRKLAVRSRTELARRLPEVNL